LAVLRNGGKPGVDITMAVRLPSFARCRNPGYGGYMSVYGFDEYVAMDARIGHLLREAESADEGGHRFCRFEAWYGEGSQGLGFRGQVNELVGYMREGIGPVPLGTSNAYDVVYERIYGAPPDCKGRCACNSLALTA